jgi:hypothetical protein
MAAIVELNKLTCGWLTHGKLLFFVSPKKSNQKKGDPGWRNHSCAPRFLAGAELQHVLVL